MSKVKKIAIGVYVNPENIREINEFSNEQSKNGKKNDSGRKYSKHDFLVDAIEEYSKDNGLKTSPKIQKNE